MSIKIDFCVFQTCYMKEHAIIYPCQIHFSLHNSIDIKMNASLRWNIPSTTFCCTQIDWRYNLWLDKYEVLYNIKTYSASVDIKINTIQHFYSYTIYLRSFKIRYNFMFSSFEFIKYTIVIWPSVLDNTLLCFYISLSHLPSLHRQPVFLFYQK